MSLKSFPLPPELTAELELLITKTDVGITAAVRANRRKRFLSDIRAKTVTLAQCVLAAKQFGKISTTMAAKDIIAAFASMLLNSDDIFKAVASVAAAFYTHRDGPNPKLWGDGASAPITKHNEVWIRHTGNLNDWWLHWDNPVGHFIEKTGVLGATYTTVDGDKPEAELQWWCKTPLRQPTTPISVLTSGVLLSNPKRKHSHDVEAGAIILFRLLFVLPTDQAYSPPDPDPNPEALLLTRGAFVDLAYNLEAEVV